MNKNLYNISKFVFYLSRFVTVSFEISVKIGVILCDHTCQIAACIENCPEQRKSGLLSSNFMEKLQKKQI